MVRRGVCFLHAVAGPLPSVGLGVFSIDNLWGEGKYECIDGQGNRVMQTFDKSQRLMNSDTHHSMRLYVLLQQQGESNSSS